MLTYDFDVILPRLDVYVPMFLSLDSIFRQMRKITKLLHKNYQKNVNFLKFLKFYK